MTRRANQMHGTSIGPSPSCGRAASVLRRVSLCLGLLGLSACMGHDIDAIREVEPSGPAFTQALAAEYRAFALFEADEMYDWIDAGHFARKGLRAAAGEEVEAERLEEWRVPRDHQAELAAARDSLVTALDTDARVKAPLVAARAQGSFDCWVEQQEENHQPDDTAACRDAFYSNINILSAILEPEPEPEPAPMPVPPPISGIEERAPFAVVLSAFDSAAPDHQARAAAKRVADEAVRRPAAALTVIGHADRRGPEAYNLELSLRRAEAMRDALVARGVAAARIEVVARGEWEPAVPTADGVAEPANRRVEVYFKGGEAQEPAISGVSHPSVTTVDPAPEHSVIHRTTAMAGDPAKAARRLHPTSARIKVAVKTTRPSLTEDRPNAGSERARAVCDAPAGPIWCGAAGRPAAGGGTGKGSITAGARMLPTPLDPDRIGAVRAVALASPTNFPNKET